MPMQGFFFQTRKVSHTINRPLSKALETCSSVSTASLKALLVYLGDTATYFNESDRRSGVQQIDKGIVSLYDAFLRWDLLGESL
jgi:hypothetical protein